MPDENSSPAVRPTHDPETGPSIPRQTESVPRSPGGYVRTKKRRRILVVVVLLVLIVFSLFLWRYLSSYESTDDAQVDVHLYPVSSRIGG
jgi:membrane fusion protein (multidrug efflux system)